MPALKKLGQHKLLLDTHIWLWTVLKNPKLGTHYIDSLKPAVENHRLYVSPISVWEISMLVAKKRVELEMDCLDWVEKSLRKILLTPFSPRIAVQSTRLPGLNHGDPADRILIATARELNAVLITHDQKLLEFGQGNFISVFDPLN
ncbi:MAG: type II toxin-antitoxin system VapC family toxin [Chlamydiia bacterium]|nr:type II toxin-antitoxin system VapC family toxin [Chlamydiia bacterium]